MRSSQNLPGHDGIFGLNQALSRYDDTLLTQIFSTANTACSRLFIFVYPHWPNTQWRWAVHVLYIWILGSNLLYASFITCLSSQIVWPRGAAAWWQVLITVQQSSLVVMWACATWGCTTYKVHIYASCAYASYIQKRWHSHHAAQHVLSKHA